MPWGFRDTDFDIKAHVYFTSHDTLFPPMLWVAKPSVHLLLLQLLCLSLVPIVAPPVKELARPPGVEGAALPTSSRECQPCLCHLYPDWLNQLFCQVGSLKPVFLCYLRLLDDWHQLQHTSALYICLELPELPIVIF